MPKSQWLNFRGKVLGLRHRSVIDQYRNDRNAPLERVFDFQTNKVFRIVDSSHAAFPLSRPVGTDHRNNDLRSLDCFLDLLTEIQTRSDRGEIHEDISLAESSFQMVVDATRDRERVFSTIRNCDQH